MQCSKLPHGERITPLRTFLEELRGPTLVAACALQEAQVVAGFEFPSFPRLAVPAGCLSHVLLGAGSAILPGPAKVQLRPRKAGARSGAQPAPRLVRRSCAHAAERLGHSIALLRLLPPPVSRLRTAVARVLKPHGPTPAIATSDVNTVQQIRLMYHGVSPLQRDEGLQPSPRGHEKAALELLSSRVQAHYNGDVGGDVPVGVVRAPLVVEVAADHGVAHRASFGVPLPHEGLDP
mmetsp:Transcript_68240/g.215954  ORF Transcript_68240/g.215954 Transcript_68240/m.215954 type:complete len:235 (+) Transcript_68240:488-1192(+)